MKKLDLNTFREDFEENPILAKSELVADAMGCLLGAWKEGYYSLDDLENLNYSEVCEWNGWPDWQDGGVFEQAVDIAADAALCILGYRPVHCIEGVKPLR